MDLSRGTGTIAYTIAERLKSAGHKAYFAGGCVRDFLMKKEPQDFDIATSAAPAEVEALFPKTVAVGKQFGVIIVVQDDAKHFEVATFRTEDGYQDGRHPSNVKFTGPEEDAHRRDFTVNGLFYDPFGKKVIDYVGGEADIAAKRIRAIGEPAKRFAEDKLRLLRAVRFAANLNFEIEGQTWQAICKQAKEIHAVSAERIRDELIKTFTRSGAAKGYRLLSDSGLMKEILPEIEAMKGVQQPPEYHPEGDVFVHTRMLLEQLEGNDSIALAFGALFHDIAKPRTYAVRNGRICFYEHAPIGARMTEEIMRRLRFSNREIADVAEAVANHMKFGDVQKMREGKLKRFVSRPTFSEELELHKIDCRACHGILDNYIFLKEKMLEYAAEELKPEPVLNGNDLKELGMKPGPKMKPLLEEAYELQLEGKIKTREEAMTWARSQLTLR
ncbi:MAG: CCA tRNA nucleotidyltransferase [Candidatus Omnitrophota bacterium]|nr:CCA tRNA nucleotidyltransferase [Candidatus Omnitrophota bacterium]